MIKDVPLQVIRLRGFSHASCLHPHRHSFYMLVWVTLGEFNHRVNYRDHALKPGQVCLLNESEIHQVIKYPADGWMLLIKPRLYDACLKLYQNGENYDLFDATGKQLDADGINTFETLFPLLEQESLRYPESPQLAAYLSLLLTIVARNFRPAFALSRQPEEMEQFRKLKKLIGQHFVTERRAKFYSNALGLPVRRLNAVSKKACGKLVQEMVSDRLLAECEALLAETAMPVKRIVFELGFSGHAQLGYFFKRAKVTNHLPPRGVVMVFMSVSASGVGIAFCAA